MASQARILHHICLLFVNAESTPLVKGQGARRILRAGM